MKLTNVVRKKSQVSKAVQQNPIAVQILYTDSSLGVKICTLALERFLVKTTTYIFDKSIASVHILYSLIVSHTYGFKTRYQTKEMPSKLGGNTARRFLQNHILRNIYQQNFT